MGTYNLLQEHGFGPDGDTADLTFNPCWLIYVVRYKSVLSSSKQRMALRTPLNSGDVSFDDDVTALNATRQPILITGDAVAMDVSTTKGRYTQSLQAVLKPRKNYLSLLIPGDWVFAWMMNTREAYKSVISRLKKGEACNGFSDGLKFVGRIQDIRKVLMQGGSGLKTVQYNLQAIGFGELDSSVFFDPNLSRNERYIEKYLQDLNIPLSQFIGDAAKEAGESGGIDINKVLPALIKAVIGEGLQGVATASGGLALAQGASIATQDAPFAYVVPDAVARILGISTPSKGTVFSYADILTLIQGLQKYDNGTFPQMFFPSGVTYDETSVSNRHFTDKPLKGVFLPTAISFDNKSVWNLLNEFLNPAINEMYTSLRLTPNGRVMPSLTVRQLPFSSPVMTQAKGPKVTSFAELPRWKAPPVLVRGMDIGRSDGERTNFIHIYGVPAKPTEGTQMSDQLIRFPPISDPQDIKRHGLRPHFGQVNTGPTDIIGGGPSEWMTVRADFLMGQHLTLSGVCSLYGVTPPIVPGDNFEFEDALFHIEAVNHHVDISQDGTKNFSTQLSLSHGVRSDLPVAQARIPKKKRVKRKAHLREDLLASKSQFVRSGESADADELDKRLADVGGSQAFLQAITQQQEGIELEALDDGTNADVFLYSGVHDDDNTSLDPGISTEDLLEAEDNVR